MSLDGFIGNITFDGFIGNITFGVDLLCDACRFGNLPQVKYLIETGIFFHSSDIYDKQPMQCAIEHGHLEIVKYLVSIGAHREIYTDGPWRWAVESDKFDIIEYFLSPEYPGELFIDCMVGAAVERDRIEVIKYIISKGFDVFKYLPRFTALNSGKSTTIKYMAGLILNEMRRHVLFMLISGNKTIGKDLLNAIKFRYVEYYRFYQKLNKFYQKLNKF